jgi:probable phosphoglycerate mutase
MNDLNEIEDPFICLVRHGETELSHMRCYNGTRDIALTGRGEEEARSAGRLLRPVDWASVMSSPLRRARRTAELAGFPTPDVIPELRELDYGDYEGKSTAQIREVRPTWDFWRDGVPNGDTLEGVGQRLLPFIRSFGQQSGPVLIFSHSHAIRIFAALWLELPASRASVFALNPGHICILGLHRGYPNVIHWNDGSHLSTPTEP